MLRPVVDLSIMMVASLCQQNVERISGVPYRRIIFGVTFILLEESLLATEQNYSQPAMRDQPETLSHAKPRGIGTAVVLDWGVAAELVILAPFLAMGVGPGDATARFSIAGRIGAAVVTLGIAVGAAVFGEALRRGYRPVWIAQIIINLLLFFGGIGTIPGTIHALQSGHFGSLISTFVLLVISPTIAWMLSRQSTRDWIARTSSAEARKRHGGNWLVFIIIYAIISGAIIAFSPLF